MDDSDSDSDYDEEDEEQMERKRWKHDPLFTYGDDALVRAARDPALVQKLLSEGHPVTPNALFAAIHCFEADTVKFLLEAGLDPNLRLKDVHDGEGLSDEEIASQPWANGEVSPDFECEDRSDRLPLQLAASIGVIYPNQVPRRIVVITMLLEHHVDLFAIYRQPIARLGEYAAPQPSPFPDDPYTQPWKPEEPYQYGLRSVLHGLLEDGDYVLPIITSKVIRSRLEHRDPQGRTLFLSACRSSTGADAAIDSTNSDPSHWFLENGSGVDPSITSNTRPSIFEYLQSQGADMLAVDAHGKSALHNLLESTDTIRGRQRPPQIRKSLLQLMEMHPELVNQPDRHGNTPLHAALQRIRRYTLRYSFDEMKELDTLVDDMLMAGSDPHAVDSHGNTALHYVAADGLAEFLMGEQTRRRFKTLIERGVDINARNHKGQTALELMLDDNGKRAEQRQVFYFLSVSTKKIFVPTAEEVDAEVFSLFDAAGVQWSARSSKDEPMWNVAVKHPGNQRGPAWKVILLAKAGLSAEK